MKIRNGFVTNSSSTSYILRSVTSGKLPNFDIKKICECVEKMNGYNIRYSNSGFISVIKELKSDIDEKKGCIEFEFYDVTYEENNNFESFVEGTIYVRSNEVWDKHEMICINYTKEVLNGIKSAIPKDYLLSFIFIQTPIEELGDGWSGGDTEGNPYMYIHDLYQTETKHGYITMLNGKIDFEITSIGKEISILQHASELIMSKSSKI